MTGSTDTTVNDFDEATRRYYLDAMGVQCWQLRSEVAVADINKEVLINADENQYWSQLEQSVQQCNQCVLHEKRKQAITGRGNQSADLMFVLLAPSLHDDETGLLCSGDAGELFAKMLAAINVAIDDVYITSLLKCSVAVNHTVTPSEIKHCSSYLEQQIHSVGPKFVVLLGETAIRCLLQKSMSLDDYRDLNSQSQFEFGGVPVFTSYSPHELLQQSQDKRKAWLDLQQLQKMLE